MWVDILDIITCATFGDDRVRGFGVEGVEFPIYPLTCVVALTTLLHYRAIDSAFFSFFVIIILVTKHNIG